MKSFDASAAQTAPMHQPRFQLALAELISFVEDRTARLLFAQALTEGGGIAIANRLRKSPHLTPEERDFAGDVLRRDEVAHLNWALDTAQHFNGGKNRRYGRWQRLCDDAMYDALAPLKEGGVSKDRALLIYLSRGERVFVRKFETYEKVLNVVLPDEFKYGIARLQIDENRHIAWGLAVYERMRRSIRSEAGDSGSRVSLKNTPIHWASAELAEIMHDLTNI